MVNATEKLISIESACGGIGILTVESAGGVYGVMEEIETFANIGKLELFRMRDQWVIGRQDDRASIVVAYVDYMG